MAKYRLLNKQGYGNSVIQGATYSGKRIIEGGTVAQLANLFPNDWELVEEPVSDFKTIYNSLLKMQEAKDKAYGNSALKPLKIFANHHDYGARLDEKLARVQNSTVLRKNDVADIIGGLVLICKDEGWTNFDDLID